MSGIWDVWNLGIDFLTQQIRGSTYFMRHSTLRKPTKAHRCDRHCIGEDYLSKTGMGERISTDGGVR